MKVSKRIVAGIAAIAAACVIAVPSFAFATGAGAAPGAQVDPVVRESVAAAAQTSAAACAGYLDADGDGVCDNRTNGGRGAGAGYVDADGDGVCDNWGTGACAGYVDANGDGVCDTCGAANGGWGHHGCGAGCGGYVDADGDGICDNFGTSNQGQGAASGTGAGWGCGNGGGHGHHGGGHHGWR